MAVFLIVLLWGEPEALERWCLHPSVVLYPIYTPACCYDRENPGKKVWLLPYSGDLKSLGFFFLSHGWYERSHDYNKLRISLLGLLNQMSFRLVSIKRQAEMNKCSQTISADIHLYISGTLFMFFGYFWDRSKSCSYMSKVVVNVKIKASHCSLISGVNRF